VVLVLIVLSEIGGVAEFLVECNGGFDETPDNRGMKKIALVEFDRGHLIFSAWFQTWFEFTEALAAPEAEEDAVFLGADEEDRPIREIDEVSPFDFFPGACGGGGDRAEFLDTGPSPSGEGRDVSIRIPGRDVLFHEQ